MRKHYYLFLALFISLFAVVSCEDDETASVNKAEELVKYLEQDDFVNTAMPAMITAGDVRAANTSGNAYIIDVRSADAYNAGHIKNAHNVALGDVLTHVENADIGDNDKIIMVCYSGQEAGYATSLLRLSGYDNAYCLKFGMSAWHSEFSGPWSGNIGNGYSSQLVKEANAKNEAGELPELSVDATEPAEIFNARASEVANEWGDATITNEKAFASPEDYYIVNYWSEAHYKLGHIPTAIQYTPKASMKLEADLKTLPKDQTIVVYCYTGQTSAHLTAYLRVLGYDAKSLLFGVNGMDYDMTVEHEMPHFADSYVMDYNYVTE